MTFKKGVLIRVIITFLNKDFHTDQNKEGNISVNMHKHLFHNIQSICMNVI